jgi:hypothetical protein
VRLQHIQSIVVSIAHPHASAENIHVEEFGEGAYSRVSDCLVTLDTDHMFDTGVLAENSSKLFGVTRGDKDKLDAALRLLLIDLPISDCFLQI